MSYKKITRIISSLFCLLSLSTQVNAGTTQAQITFTSNEITAQKILYKIELLPKLGDDFSFFVVVTGTILLATSITGKHLTRKREKK